MSFPLVSLGDFVKIARNSISPEKIQSGTTYVGLENIDGSGIFVDVKAVDAGELASAKFVFTQKQVLFGKLRPYLKKIARPDFDGVCSTDILPLLPSKEIDRDYLFHTLRRQSFVDDVSSLSSGANLPRIAPKVLSGMQIPLPPMEEQRRIAAILDKADALRAQRRAAIAKLDELLQSVFIEIFGDPVTNPKRWPLVNLSELGMLDRGISKHRPRGAPELLGGMHPLIQTGDVARSDGYIRRYTSTYSDVGLAQSKKWPAGTLCITIAANIAETGILTFDACFPDSVVGFTPNEKCTVEFVQKLFGFLQSILEDRAPQSAQKNINLAILRSLEVPRPPRELQQRFARIAEKIESQKQTMQLAAEKSETLFASLQQRAFSGKL